MDSRPEVAAALEREQRDALTLWRSLGASDWTRPSLCKGWTVKDVAVHCVRGETEIFRPMLRRALAGDATAPAGFDLVAINDRQIADGRAVPPAQLIDEADAAIEETQRMLKEMSDEEWVAPSWNPIAPGTAGFYVKGRIWEWWTHNQDVRIPLKRPGGRGPERTTPVVEVVRDGIPGVFLPGKARDVHVSYAFQVGPTGFTIRIDDGAIAIDPVFDPKATSRVKADPATFVLVGTRRISQAKAVLTGKFRPAGNPVAGLKFLSYFRAA